MGALCLAQGPAHARPRLRGQRQRPAGAAAGKPARALRVPQVFRLRRAGRAARCASASARTGSAAPARNGIDSANNIKLGDGGIREIEFVVQLAQLIRGGRMPACSAAACSKRCTPKAPPACCPKPTRSGWRPPTASCAAPSTRCSTAKTSRPTCCPATPPCAPRWRRRWACRPANSRTRWPRTAPSSRGLSATCSAWSAWATPRSRAGRRCGRQGRTRRTVRAGRTDPSGLRRRGRRPAAARRHPDGQPPRAQPARRQPPPRRALLPAALRAARQTPAPLQAAVRLFDLIETIAQRSAWPCWPNIPTRWRAWRAWWPPAPGPRST